MHDIRDIRDCWVNSGYLHCFCLSSVLGLSLHALVTFELWLLFGRVATWLYELRIYHDIRAKTNSILVWQCAKICDLHTHPYGTPQRQCATPTPYASSSGNLQNLTCSAARCTVIMYHILKGVLRPKTSGGNLPRASSKAENHYFWP